jgi:hypothetical protein
MSDVITEYQKWKRQGDDLRVQAKEAMESRFRELLSEAVQIAEEYRADFGAPLKPSVPITAFRYKASARPKAKKVAVKHKPATKSARVTPAPTAVAAKPNPQVTGLQKRLAAAKKKLDFAKAAGKPTQLFEDRIYEIEDELRMVGNAQ